MTTFMAFYKEVKEFLGLDSLNEECANILMKEFYLNANYDVEAAGKRLEKVLK